MTTRRPADVRRILDRDERFEVCVAAADAGGAVQAALREEPDIGPLDLCMPGNGMAAVWERGRLNVQVPERPISIGGTCQIWVSESYCGTNITIYYSDA